MKSSLYQKLQERKVIQTFILYLAGSWGVLEAISFFSARYTWPEWIFDMTLVLILCGLPCSIITSWFHGLPDQQNMPKIEVILLTINFVLALSFKRVRFSGTKEKNDT